MEAKTPARRALAVLDTPPAPDAAVPAKRISAKVRAGIDAMVTGQCKTIKEAAEKAGLSREHFTRELAKPHIAEYLRQKVVRNLALQAARAGVVKGELLDSPNAMVADRASTFILGLAGIAPADNLQHTRPGDQNSPGVCIIIQQGPAPAPAPAAIDRPMQPVITVEPAPTPPRFNEIITP